MIIAYALKEERISGGIMKADGAAFRSGDNWYELKFSCQPSTDASEIAAFEFSVGAPIAEDEWKELGLPAPGGDAHRH